MSTGPLLSLPLTRLADLVGVETSFTGNDTRRHQADATVIRALLGALGFPADTDHEAESTWRATKLGRMRRGVEPVLVHRLVDPGPISLTLPAGFDVGRSWLALEAEDGTTMHVPLTRGHATTRLDLGSQSFLSHELTLPDIGPGALGPGYYQARLEGPGLEAQATLIVAPTCPLPRRSWGLFMPLHALRTDQDWGIGSYVDLVALAEWVGELGGGFVGSLPLYPTFDEPPIDPSPYLPVSRLAYNEIYIDPTALPELADCPDAQNILGSPGFAHAVRQLRGATHVDYESVAALRARVLLPLSHVLLEGHSPRRQALRQFGEAHRELVAYAGFRAQHHGAGSPVSCDDEVALAHYHLYTQWVAHQQLQEAGASVPLYADLPVGVAAGGFDPWAFPESFVPGVHGGAPPDHFFHGGQDWAFPPLHPEGMRQSGYRYMISVLRRACQNAGIVRIDHVMGLQRLYCIPPGGDATHGAYVQYRAEELHAIVALEAHRAGTVVVGEDLGTVPPGMRERMAEDNMLRSWVMEFESTETEPLPRPPRQVLASWGTHDLPRFGAFLAGEDIVERGASGAETEAQAQADRQERQRWARALEQSLAIEADDADAGGRVLVGALEHLARSPADLLLVDLEELWGEPEPQNHPGTGPEAGNWTKRGARTLETARSDTILTATLSGLDSARRESDLVP